MTITGNTLPPAASPDSSLTIRTLAGGILGGQISSNTLDQLQLDFAGGLAGNLGVSSNTVREQASFVNSGAVGAGTMHLVGNNFSIRPGRPE